MGILLEKDNNSGEMFDKTLGTPSAQKILRFLVCWEKIPFRELIAKSNLSESNVHSTLRKLQRSGLVSSDVRGIYQLTDDDFTKTLTASYSILIKRIIARNLYNLSKQMEVTSPEKILDQLLLLKDLYGPYIDRYYSKKFSSLVGSLINNI
ncbi:MAG: winged helix-turn-helix domain-containing protein [Candidatus Hodarchaeales archaeon]|jgi:DNA-binding transcriptional ArsR family regulator